MSKLKKEVAELRRRVEQLEDDRSIAYFRPGYYGASFKVSHKELTKRLVRHLGLQVEYIWPRSV
jgi:hypothetical protein